MTAIERAAARTRTATAILTGIAIGVGAFLIGVASPAQADSLPPGPAPVQQRNGGVTADELPTVQIDSGVVWNQVLVGDTVYAGGSFSETRPAGAAPGTNLTPRSNLLAYSITTGDLLPFAPQINGTVKSLAVSPDGKTLYVGGSFNSVDGQTRWNLAAFDVATGALVPTFRAAVGGSYVNAIAVTDTAVYVGGLIGAGNGVQRKAFAAFNTNGALLGWAPTADLQVDTMTLTPQKDKLIVGGRFSTINGVTERGMAALDLTTGALLPWEAPNVIKNGLGTGSNAGKAGIWHLTIDANAVYGTGWVFSNASVGNLEGLFSANPESGDINWIADCHGDHFGIYSDGTTVYTTSHEHACESDNGMAQVQPQNMRNASAVTVATKGTLSRTPWASSIYTDWSGWPAPAVVDWYPDWLTGKATGMGDAGYSIVGNGTYIAVGGEFVGVNDQRQQGLVRFSSSPPGGAKEGPRLSGTDWAPVARSVSDGTVRVAVPGNWDRDDLNLTYKLMRVGTATPVATKTVRTTYWNLPQVTLVDRGLSPGTMATYYVVASDADGNSATSAGTSVTVSGTSTPAYTSAVLDGGASLYWPLGGTPTQAATDLAGSNDGQVGSGVGTTTGSGAISGDPAPASTFGGSSNGLIGSSQKATVWSAFSTELWFKTTTTHGGKLVGYGSSPSGSSSSYDRHVYMLDNGKLTFGTYPGLVRTMTSTGSYNDGSWHYLVAEQGEDGMKLYVDGQLVASDPTVNVSQSYSGYWRLGGDNLSGWPNRPDSDYFKGSMDAFAVYDTALSPAQIAAHYALGSGQGLPTASFTATPNALDVAVDASGSTPAPGQTIASYGWDWGDGSAAGSGKTATHSYEAPGGYTITLTVTDADGLLATTSKTVTVTAPHQDPVASFTSSTSGLTLTVDGSGSTASDGATLQHSWDWGDGTAAGSGVAASHDYASAGSYPVTLTVTDSLGSTDAITQTVQVSSQTYLAKDAFDRSVDPGWGTADTGGTWSGTGGFSVADGAGTIAVSPSSTLSTTLSAVSASDTGSRFTVGTDVVPDGTLHVNYGVHLSASGEYRLKLRFLASGVVHVGIAKVSGGAETLIADEVLPGYTQQAGQRLQVRLDAQAAGSATTLKAKVWPDGQSEPTDWTLTASDSAAALQGSGTLGFSTYLSGSATAQVHVVVDDLAVTGPAPTPPAAPVASFTSSVSGLTVSVDASGSTASGTPQYAWSWGDGSPDGSGVTASHTYASAGDYTVTLTVTDGQGATDTASRTVHATAQVYIANDSFDRTVASGWGSAPTGGSWSGTGGFSVGDGVGRTTIQPGQTLASSMSDVDARDADSTFTVGTDQVADATLHVNYGVRVSQAGEYRLKLRFMADGTVHVGLAKVVGGAETLIADRVLDGYTQQPEQRLQVRFQAVTSGGATTLRAKVWQAGQAEPADWYVTASDSQPELQTTGSVAFSPYLSGRASGPSVVSFDDLAVLPAG